MREFRLPDALAAKWKRLMDLLALAAGAAAARVAHADGDALRTLAAGGEAPPWRPGDTQPLGGSGSFCESVIASCDRLAVQAPDEDLTWRLLNPNWRENPDRALGMCSFLGLPVRLPHGSVFGCVSLMRTDEMAFDTQAENLLEVFRDSIEADLAALRLEAEAAALADDPVVGALSVDSAGTVRRGTRRFRDLWRLKDGEAATSDFRELLSAMAVKAADPDEVRQHMLTLAQHPAAAPDSNEILLADGRLLEARSRAATDADGNAWGRVWAFADVTDYQNADGSLRELALTDPVTGLVSRTHFRRMGNKEIERAKRYGMPLSLILLHIDGLTHVAADHTPGAVDSLLAHIASLGKNVVRNLDIFSRIDDHRFALLLPETDREGAQAMADRITALFAQADFLAGNHPVYIAPRIAIACHSREIIALDSLISIASAAMETR